MQTSCSHSFLGCGSTEGPRAFLPMARVTFHPYLSLSFQLSCLIPGEASRPL